MLPHVLSAQSGTASDADLTPSICELHVWPANDLRSTYHGWFHGGLVDGAVQGREGYRKLPDSPLGTARQVEVLHTLPVAERLGLPTYRTVIHDNALDSRTVRQATGRLLTEASRCYAELVVDDAFFQEDVVTGKYLKVLYRFRSFDGETPVRRFGTYSQIKLLLFPPTTREDGDAALDELTKAYGDALGEFGAALNKPPGKIRDK